MKSRNKIKLANLTTWTMVITISVIAIWFIGFVVANTFDLNVFTKRTSDFMFGFIGFSAVLVLCSAILNISLNIGLIADSKVQEMKTEGSNLLGKRFYLVTSLGIVALITFLFIGDYLTRKNEENKLVSAADYIVETYSESIAKIAPSLTDTSKVGQIPEILKFLSNQKSEFPSVTLLTSGKYDGQLTYLEITHWESEKSLKEPLFGNSFYKCQDYDCEYLQDLFTGKTVEPLFWTEKNDYKLYYPFIENNTKYILLFTKYQRHGKVGSY
tara:strand:+ start:30 stop:839 length:810 start_codon:yes stop_codon:yes gene_type:complete